MRLTPLLYLMKYYYSADFIITVVHNNVNMWMLRISVVQLFVTEGTCILMRLRGTSYQFKAQRLLKLFLVISVRNDSLAIWIISTICNVPNRHIPVIQPMRRFLSDIPIWYFHFK